MQVQGTWEAPCTFRGGEEDFHKAIIAHMFWFVKRNWEGKAAEKGEYWSTKNAKESERREKVSAWRDQRGRWCFLGEYNLDGEAGW